MRWSIRWRLTLWNLLALAAVLLGFAGLVYGLAAHALYEKTDHDLAAAAQLLEQDCAPAAALSQGQGCPGGRGSGQYVGLR